MIVVLYCQQAVDTLYIATVQTDEAALPHPCVLWV